MHKQLVLLVELNAPKKPSTVVNLHNTVWDFMHNHEHRFWDRYNIGGRYKGIKSGTVISGCDKEILSYNGNEYESGYESGLVNLMEIFGLIT